MGKVIYEGWKPVSEEESKQVYVVVGAGLARQASPAPRPELLYRVVEHNGGLVFAEREEAEFVSKIHEAMECSKTWGELKAAMPNDEEFRFVLEAYMENEELEEEPGPEEAFDGTEIVPWRDGDYPQWLQAEMDDVLPADVLEAYASRDATFLNGDFFFIDAKNKDAVLRALEERGYVLVDAQDMHFS